MSEHVLLKVGMLKKTQKCEVCRTVYRFVSKEFNKFNIKSIMWH